MDNPTYTSHSLRVRAHHTEDTHIMRTSLLRLSSTDSGNLQKQHIFREFSCQGDGIPSAYPDAHPVFYCIWHCRVCGGWQYFLEPLLRMMSGACPPPAPSVISVDGSAADGCKCIFHTSALHLCICMDGNLYIIFICHIQTVIDNQVLHPSPHGSSVP